MPLKVTFVRVGKSADNVGIIPMWGYYGHFGVLLVDNFATDQPVSDDGIRVLEDFIKPFISALEKALIIQQYQDKITQLQEAGDLIEAQKEMLIRMERRNTVGRFTAILAHNLINPVLSVMGYLEKMEKECPKGFLQEQLLEAIRQDVQNLEEFVRDFISQVHTEYPLRHFWDLNHLIGEVISSYRCFNNILAPSVAFEEGVIPLVRLDYERVTGSLSRIMGIVDALARGLDGMTISTVREGPSVTLRLSLPHPFPCPGGVIGERIRREVDHLRRFLVEDEIELQQGADFFALTFKI